MVLGTGQGCFSFTHSTTLRTVDEMKNESKNVRFLPFSALSAVNEKWESPLDETWKETSMRHMEFLGQLSLQERRPTKDSGDPRDGNPTGVWGQPQTPPTWSHGRDWDLQEQQRLREVQTTEIPQTPLCQQQLSAFKEEI